MKFTLYLFTIFTFKVHAGWVVNCENYCAFSEFPNNCQGVYYEYPDGYKNYSAFSENYQGCLETRYLTTDLSFLDSHVLPYNQITCNCPATSVTLPDENSDLTEATKIRLQRLREQLRNWVMCAPPLDSYQPNINSHFSYNQIKTCKEFKKQNKVGAYFLLKNCEPGQAAWGGGCSLYGDTPVYVFWQCLSGVKERCDDIKRAQNSSTGAWYRNEVQRKYPPLGAGGALFSRDQSLGVLGYLIATKDKSAAQKWLIFIRDNPKYLGFYSLCPQRTGKKPAEVSTRAWNDTLPDDRCMINTSLWGTIYKIYQYIGFTNSELNLISSDIYQKMQLGDPVNIATIVSSVPFTPAKGPDSYMMNLLANNTHLMFQINQKPSSLIAAMNLINDRTSKLNPRFHLLAKGKATEYGAYLIRKYCRGNRPNFGYWSKFGNQSAVYYGLPADQAEFYVGGNMDASYPYFNSVAFGDRALESGHECIGWINLYLGNNQEMKLVCQNGDPLVDGACQKKSFPKAVIPPVAGMGYMPHFPWAPDVYFGAINFNECIGSNSQFESQNTWCKSFGITPLSFDLANRTEYINPSPTVPGLYYQAINSTCPSGGTFMNGECRLVSFPVPNPNLLQGISYSVKTTAGIPGVYYPPISNACPWGGIKNSDGCLVYDGSLDNFEIDKEYFVRRNFRWPGIYYHPEVKPISVLQLKK